MSGKAKNTEEEPKAKVAKQTYFNPEVGVVEASSLEEAQKLIEKSKKDDKVGDGDNQ